MRRAQAEDVVVGDAKLTEGERLVRERGIEGAVLVLIEIGEEMTREEGVIFDIRLYAATRKQERERIVGRAKRE